MDISESVNLGAFSKRTNDIRVTIIVTIFITQKSVKSTCKITSMSPCESKFSFIFSSQRNCEYSNKRLIIINNKNELAIMLCEKNNTINRAFDLLSGSEAQHPGTSIDVMKLSHKSFILCTNSAVVMKLRHLD